jgi:hypothetical protein
LLLTSHSPAGGSSQVATRNRFALGDRSREPLDSLKTWLLANKSTIMLVVLTVLSAVMVAAGLEMIG